MENKLLIFEGAGWEGAEHNGVGNCRIRTRIETKDGRIIYFECSSLKKHDEVIGFVSHCFEQKDERTNHTPHLSNIERLRFDYSVWGIIDFVNKHLNCDFNNFEVNNKNLKVHNTILPLCNCKR